MAFLYFGLGGSSIINSFISTPVDRNKSKFELFLEVSRECLCLALLVYGLVVAIPLVPSIVPLADDNHFKFRKTAELIVVSAVVFTHERLLNKIHYLIGVDNFLYFIFYILYFIFYILYFIFYILYFIFYILLFEISFQMKI